MFVLFMSLIYFLVVALFLFIDLYRMNQIDRYVISAYYFETLCSIWKRFDMMDYLIWIECILCCEKRSSFKCWRWQKFTLKSFVTLNNMRYTEILAFYGSTKIEKFCYQKSAVSKYRHSDEKWACCYCLFPTSLKWLEYYDSAKLLIYFIYHQLSTFVELYVTWQIIIIFRKKVYESIITIRIYLLYFILFCSVLIRFLISISILSPWLRILITLYIYWISSTVW